MLSSKLQDTVRTELTGCFEYVKFEITEVENKAKLKFKFQDLTVQSLKVKFCYGVKIKY